MASADLLPETLGLTHLEWKFMIYFFLADFWVLGSVWILFLQSNGLDLTQVALIDIAFWLTMFVFEIPTGIIADRFGRKVSLFLSYNVIFVGVMIFAFSSQFLWFIISYIVWAIGMTMNSGANEAWFYDEVKYQEASRDNPDYDARYQKVYGRIRAVAGISAALASVLGGYLGLFSLQIPIIVTAFVFLSAGYWILLITEHREESPKSSMGKTRDAFANLRQTPLLRLLGIIVVLELAVMTIIFWIQPYLDYFSYDPDAIGLIMGAGILCSSIGSYFSAAGSKLLGGFALIVPVLLIGISFAFMFLLGSIGVIMLYFLIRMVRSMNYPYLSRLANNEIDSDNRATTLSVIAAISTIFLMFYELGTAYLIETVSYASYFLLTGIVVLLVGGFLSILVYRS